MSDRVQLATRTVASVTDRNGNVLATAGGWYDKATGIPILDPDEIARLEAKMPKGQYAKGDRVELLENDDETWTPGTVRADHGAGTYLIRKGDGSVIGVPADRLRPVED